MKVCQFNFKKLIKSNEKPALSAQIAGFLCEGGEKNLC